MKEFCDCCQAVDFDRIVPALKIFLNTLVRKIDIVDAKANAHELDLLLKHSMRSYTMEILTLAKLSLPRISVVVPMFNSRAFLAERVRTITTQTIPYWELVIVDDCSTEQFEDIIETFQQDVSFILYRRRSKYTSVFSLWTEVVQKLTGDYVWIAEVDDLSQPTFLFELLSLMQKIHL